MPKVLIITFFLCVPIALSAQKKFGVYFQGTSSTAKIINPQSHENSIFIYSNREGFGAGASLDFRINQRLSLSYRVGYTQKGFVGATRTNEIGETIPIGSSTIHFVGLDQIMKVWVKPEKVYFLAGISNARMVANDLPSEFENPSAGSSMIKRDDYHDWSFGGLVGIGYDYDGTLYFEGGLNFDISPSLETSDALIRNNFLYANIGFRLF